MHCDIDQFCFSSSIKAIKTINMKQILKLFCLSTHVFCSSGIQLKFSYDDAWYVVTTAGCIVTNSILKMNNMVVQPSSPPPPPPYYIPRHVETRMQGRCRTCNCIKLTHFI